MYSTACLQSDSQASALEVVPQAAALDGTPHPRRETEEVVLRSNRHPEVETRQPSPPPMHSNGDDKAVLLQKLRRQKRALFQKYHIQPPSNNDVDNKSSTLASFHQKVSAYRSAVSSLSQKKTSSSPLVPVTALGNDKAKPEKIFDFENDSGCVSGKLLLDWFTCSRSNQGSLSPKQTKERLESGTGLG